jgi:hypothetical protein
LDITTAMAGDGAGLGMERSGLMDRLAETELTS